MAREYAKIRTDIWGDEDWRKVSGPEKLLYFTLLSHATLSYAGVADWRPNRLAPLVDESWTVDALRNVAASLEARHLIVTDDATEEVLVRSFIRHDGLMKQPRLAVSMSAAFTAVASVKLKQVIAFEVQKLRGEQPELACWGDARVATVLEHSGVDVKTLGPGLGIDLGSVSEAFGRNVGEGLVSPTSTATTTTTKASPLPGKLREMPLPKDWAPTADHIERSRELRVDVIDEAENFRLHAEAHDRRAKNWNAAFTTWLKKSKPKPPAGGNNWMDRSV